MVRSLLRQFLMGNSEYGFASGVDGDAWRHADLGSGRNELDANARHFAASAQKN